MFKNYFKTAWRNLVKQKGLSFISVFGLSVGIACFALCTLYALNEFSFDSFHKNANNIYMVHNTDTATKSTGASEFIFTPMPLGPAMKQDLPTVENYVRYIQPYEVFIKVNNEGRRENISYTDPSFFSVFSFKLKYGNTTTALNDLHSIVLTEETAKRLFGKTNAIGESLQMKVENTFEPFTVMAIAENPPSNSSFQFSMISSFNYWATTTEGKMTDGQWGWNAYMTFVQLKPGSTLANNTKLLAQFKHKYQPTGLGSEGSIALESLRNMHTNPQLNGIKITPVDPKTIWILLIIAAGILLIACINFTTLAIGRSASRAKEVGVRKVIGGTKKTLIFQFISESLLLTVLSTVVGLLLAKLLLPFFNNLSGRELDFSFAQFPQLIWLIIALVFAVGILSGCYPAFVLSRFKPVDVLKKKIKLGGGNFFTRSLVTVQFVISAALIICAVVIMQQLHYMQSKYPGFNKENVVVVEALGISNTKNLYTLLKQELSAHPEIVATASADNGLGEREGMNTTSINYYDKQIMLSQFNIDADYIPTLGMQLLAGRNFNAAISSDTVSSVIINEALMNDLEWSLKNSVGKPLEGYSNYGLTKPPVVIGVVKDFNYADLHQQVQPQIFDEFPFSQPYHFFIRVKPGDPSKALAAIQTSWKKVASEYPLKYNFLDEDLNRFYQSEEHLSNIIGWAGGISIFLACLGLLGLAALAAVNRTKEIGIRKVLGASVSTIISLLSKEFLKLVLIAFVIAVPLAWYFMDKWLQNYAYRIQISGWIFLITGAATVMIALIVISFQSIKAAIANPVKSLRTE
jgi:putative ABC transport system permease protein